MSEAIELGLPAQAFDRQDDGNDLGFYAPPRLVTHIDEAAVGALTSLYRDAIPPGGRVLDLMSSWISHLPVNVTYAEVVGLGLNAAELAANPRLSHHFVQDLNRDPVLPFDDASFDGACCCVSVQYLEQPVAVMREVQRVLKAAAPFVVTFSDRCFSTKAVLIWQAVNIDRAELVALYLARAGFLLIEARQVHVRDRGGDPLWAVVGRAPDGAR